MKIGKWEIKIGKAIGDEVGTAGIMSNVFGFDGTLPKLDNPQRQVQNYTSWPYICSGKNAQAVAAIPLRLFASKTSKARKAITKTKEIDKITYDRLYKNSGIKKWMNKAVNIVEVLDHSFLDLTEKVNPFMNKFDLFELTELFLELTGNAYWYIVTANIGGKKIPIEIWVLPPQYMHIIPSKSKFIAGYIYKEGNLKIPYAEEEIVHFKFANPQDKYYGYSPLQAIVFAVNFDKGIKSYETALLKNNARPEGIFTTDLPMGEQEFKKFKKLWEKEQGSFNRGKTAFLTKGFTYKQIAWSPKDMAYTQGRKLNREEIASAYGVPMSKLTTDNVNLANAEIGEKQYAKDTIEPRLKRIEEKINEKLMPMYDANLFVAYDSPVPEEQEQELKRMTSSLNNYVTVINEEREKLGLKPVPWGDEPIAPRTVGPLQTEPPETTTPATPTPDGGDSAEDNDSDKPSGGDSDSGDAADDDKPDTPTQEQVDSFVGKVLATVKKKVQNATARH